MVNSRWSCLCVCIFCTTVFSENIDPGKQWGSWRGPVGTGIAPHGNPPTTWSEDENIRWKTPIPGSGHSTPVVWGDRIYVTTAIPHGEHIAAEFDRNHGAHDNVAPDRRFKFDILAINRRDGSVLWQKTLRDEQPHDGTHETGGWASASPITDGEHVFAYFGSSGLYCLTPDGEPVWEKDLGDMLTRHSHGEGSSTALHEDTLIVNWDHEGDSFVVALEKCTGREKWRKSRDEMTSWSSPLIVKHGKKTQVVIPATNRVRSYDLDNGDVLWECAGLSRNVVATPVAGHGLVFVANSYDWQAMLAIDLSKATGDITGTSAIVWTKDRHTPYVPSPLLYDDQLYYTKHLQAFVSSVDARTGKLHFGPERLKGIDLIFASPVAAAGHIYIVSRNGNTAVLKHGTEFKPIALNKLDDSFSASPVIVGRDLYLRGETHLYCISESKTK